MLGARLIHGAVWENRAAGTISASGPEPADFGGGSISSPIRGTADGALTHSGRQHVTHSGLNGLVKANSFVEPADATTERER
jgi:hypothetical protein